MEPLLPKRMGKIILRLDFAVFIINSRKSRMAELRTKNYYLVPSLFFVWVILMGITGRKRRLTRN